LLADVLGVELVVKGLRSVDLLQDVLLLSVSWLRHACFEAVAQPLALIAVEDVRVFGTNLEGVCRAQARENLAQLHGFLAAESTNVEGAIQIPDGQTMGFHIQVAVIWNRKSWLCPTQRIDIGNQVTAGAVGLDEGHDTGVFIDARVWNILCPAEWLVRNCHFLEDFIPELVINNELRNRAQELTGLCTLDDAVVIGGGQSNQTADTEVCQAVSGSASELCWVIHGTNTNDGAGTLGQTSNGVTGTNTTWVGQVNGNSREVIHRQLVLAGTGDDVFVGINKLSKGLVFTVFNS